MLRRLMRRAIAPGPPDRHRGAFLPRFAEVVRELMGAGLSRAARAGETVDMWLAREEEAFEPHARAGHADARRASSRGRASAARRASAPTRRSSSTTPTASRSTSRVELAAEQGLGVDEQGFEDLMEEQRVRARASAGRGGRDAAARGCARVGGRDGRPRPTFTGYETLSRRRRSARSREADGRVLASSSTRRSTRRAAARCTTAGTVECEDGGCRAEVTDVRALRRRPGARLVPLDRGELHAGRARGGARRPARAGARRKRTTPRRTCCTRRCASASAATCARRAPTSGRTSCASTSRTAQPLSDEDQRCVEDRVNEMGPRQPARARDHDDAGRGAQRSARWRCSARSTATRCAWSRSATAAGRASCAAARTCARTAEIGVFKLTTETSSAANVRRIEAVTGPVAVRLLRRHDQRAGGDGAALLRTLAGERSPRSRPTASTSGASWSGRSGRARAPTCRWRPATSSRSTASRRCSRSASVDDPKAMPDVADRLRNQLGDPAVVVLGADTGGPRLAARGGHARRRGARREGGRDRQGGGAGRRRRRRRARHAWRRPAGATRRSSRTPWRRRGRRSKRALGALRRGVLRVVALDYGSARCGVAVSDPTGTLATPLDAVLRPGTRRGFNRVLASCASRRRARRGRPAAVAVGRRFRADGGDARVRGRGWRRRSTCPWSSTTSASRPRSRSGGRARRRGLARRRRAPGGLAARRSQAPTAI